ncbi:MAG: ribonuclease III [Patescibacteria group bacterium]|nr:ribonuclease III [Patescibacteria group bacterium]
MPPEFETLAQQLGVSFKNIDLLRQALVHRSYLNENPGFHLGHNERLEFLGDAVIELVVTEHLYSNYPNPEGELTNWRAALVNAKMLAKIANDIELEPYLYLSRGEAADTQGKARQYILANAFEAVVGALYLDAGYAAAQAFLARFLLPQLPIILAGQLYHDPKSLFQEAAQDQLGITPTYQVLKEHGPDHAKHFTVGLYLGDELVAEGEGSSKRDAQEQAAERGLKVKGWE